MEFSFIPTNASRYSAFFKWLKPTSIPQRNEYKWPTSLRLNSSLGKFVIHISCCLLFKNILTQRKSKEYGSFTSFTLLFFALSCV